MSNSPFDPKPPLFPWYPPPAPPKPVTPSLADLIAAMQPRPPLLGDYFTETKRPKIFVSYQHSTDQYYYNEFSRIFHEGYESIYDNSLARSIDSDNSDYVIQRIRDEFITGTSCTIVLVGPTSFQRKYLDWEIKATLDKEHGLIGIQLPNVFPDYNGIVRVPPRLNANINSGYALWQELSWQQLIANPSTLQQYVTAASNRPKEWIVNPREIKKQNG